MLPGPGIGALLAAALLSAPVGPLGETIEHEFHMSGAGMAVSVVVTYLLAAAALGVPGYLLGRRWPTATSAVGLLLITLGIVASALTPGSGVLTLARVIGGIGAGAVLGATFALTGLMDRGRSQTRMALGGALVVALLFGPLVTGFLTETLSWRWGILVPALPVALFALLVTAVTGIVVLVQRGSRPVPPIPPMPPFAGGQAGPA
jgi:MFS family permease